MTHLNIHTYPQGDGGTIEMSPILDEDCQRIVGGLDIRGISQIGERQDSRGESMVFAFDCAGPDKLDAYAQSIAKAMDERGTKVLLNPEIPPPDPARCRRRGAVALRTIFRL